MGKILTKSKTRNDRQILKDKYLVQASGGYEESFKLFEPVHVEPVTTVAAVIPGLCVSGSHDKSVALFDYNSGRLVQRWTGHNQGVTKLVYADQVRAILSGSRDRSIHMWQAGDKNPVMTFEGHELVITGLSLNSSNSHFCSGSRDNSLRIWSLDTAQCISCNTISRNLVTHVHWAMGMNIIAQTSEDKQLRIWDSRTLSPAVTFAKKMHIQTCCDISEDNNYCVTSSMGFAGNGCEVTLWDLRTRSIMHEFKGHNETVHSCLFIPSAVSQRRSLLASSSSDCSVRIWDQDTRECVAWQNIPSSGPLTSLAVYEDGSICVSSFNCGIHALKLSVDNNSIAIERKAQF